MVKFNFEDSSSSGKGNQNPAGSIPRISLGDMLGFVTDHKVEFFCGGMVLVAVAVLWPLISLRMAKINALNGETDLLLQKEKPVADIDKYSKENTALMEELPLSLPENRFITKLTLLGNKRNVMISAVSPPETIDNGFFYYISTQVSCSVNSFRDALLFISDIEHSDYVLKVDSWKVRQSGAANQLNSSSVKLDMVLMVSSIEILDNAKKNSSK